MGTGTPGIYRIATAIIIVVVVVIGGLLALSDRLAWKDYMDAVAVGVGLLGVAHGIDSKSRP